MDKDDLIEFWITSSDHDNKTMIRLFDGGDYSWAMFIGHLVIEKLLKALYIQKKDENYPITHNLLRLAEKAGIEIDDDQRTFYATLTGFNINARYDDYKLTFYKLCTKEFSEKWIEKIQWQRLWIKSMLLK
jgi:HEPN domain-containing protein